MSDQATTRLAEIRSRAEAFETASMDNGAGAAYDSAADVPFLLSLVEQLQGQLGTVRESLEYSTEENARLSASILDCGSDVHARVFDEEDDDDV